MASKPAPKRVPRRSFDIKTLRATLESIPRRTLVLWLMAATLGLLMLPLTLITAALSDNVSTLEADLKAAVKAQTSMPTLPPRVQELSQQLNKIQGQANQINSLNPTFTAGSMAWTSVMAAIGNYNPNEIALDGIGRADGRLVVTGLAASDKAILTYVSSLQQSGAFKSVVLQSVTIADSQAVTMTIAPASVIPTNTPSLTPTPTTTPSLRDIFEPDEVVEQNYYLGQFQVHTFYPENDVDRVFFLAKAGRYYRIATQALGPGVDTVLTVNAGGMVLTNDDAKPGSLYSEIILPALPVDTTATVTIANRGMYGIAQVYTLIIEEILPTITPTSVFSGTTTAGTSTAQTPTGSAAQTTQATATTAAATGTTAVTSTPTQVTATSFVPTVSFPTIAIPTFALPTDAIVTPTNTSAPTATATVPTNTPVTPTATPVTPTDTPTPTLSPTPVFSIVTANLAVSSMSSTCPATIGFAGSITVRGAGSLSYAVEHYDGSSGPSQTVTVTGDTIIPVSDTWTIPGTPGEPINGWARIRITSTETYVSEQANFLLVCPSASAHQFQRARAVWTNALLGSAMNALLSAHAQFVPARAQALPNNPLSPQHAANTAQHMQLRFVIVLEPKAAGAP